MFGYIRVFKDELKVREYDLFKAYYCGLCKTLKKEYGMAARMGLSYDLTFFSLILSSLSDEREKILPQRCIANPLKNRPVAQNNDYFVYAAGVNVILMYFKLIDDIRDNHSFKSICAIPFMFSAIRKAKKRLPVFYKEAKKSMARLSVLEKNKCINPDELANEFGKTVEAFFDTDMAGDDKTQRVLSRLGYLLGRFIYLLDVCDDVEKDRKSGSFNVLLTDGCSVCREELIDSLEFTLSEVASAYNLLDIKKNKPILDNIIYLGLSKALTDTKNPVQKEKVE